VEALLVAQAVVEIQAVAEALAPVAQAREPAVLQEHLMRAIPATHRNVAVVIVQETVLLQQAPTVVEAPLVAQAVVEILALALAQAQALAALQEHLICVIPATRRNVVVAIVQDKIV